MNAAETQLAEILAANAAAGYPDCDRTSDAIAERARYQHQITQKHRIEGIPIPAADSLEARLSEHFIQGDISAAQLIAITRMILQK
ncbi:MAG: hypothetical protein Q4A74_09875 [Cardiobacteriaceae bacterium]|nr:hypothetical protein [Cardiobacteriaceae bacterium]